ncbi:ArsC/Spx/MgsR family protein [Gynuella sunshinyii]|uniref:Arsenate reductase and related protein, glutaredoxin family n=1 Tax=Gynuella sunshinyii YC6258 TaxID=1445510 RepID=A0A0C5VKQ9_9GAMM|nr:ArsC/Spx/MgsR family protein [Gynuella sunshinyii]AJQ94886.1 arsenate reductase and related protein, glutaredoxin family [Gynuella sunshinyii YC6258]
MAHITFFQKPGCINNRRQLQWLQSSGHEVHPENLLQQPWTAERLMAFFDERPLSECFNQTAPAIKSGQLNPEHLSHEDALAAMIQDPILIKRPLMIIDHTHYIQGFDQQQLHQLIGLSTADSAPAMTEDLTTCPRQTTEHSN